MKLLIVFLLLALAKLHVEGATVLPQCTWSCNTPSCDTVCVPRCQPANCSVTCSTGDPAECSAAGCGINCDPVTGQDVVNDCPTCATSCGTPSCPSGHTGCVMTCEPVDCTWDCVAPTDCEYPLCSLVCAEPTCNFVSGGALRLTKQHGLQLLLLLGMFLALYSH